MKRIYETEALLVCIGAGGENPDSAAEAELHWCAADGTSIGNMGRIEIADHRCARKLAAHLYRKVRIVIEAGPEPGE